jgi:hypothetical protein
MDDPFFMWTIAEAWDWLIHAPILGFIVLICLGLGVVGTIINLVVAGYHGWTN